MAYDPAELPRWRAIMPSGCAKRCNGSRPNCWPIARLTPPLATRALVW